MQMHPTNYPVQVVMTAYQMSLKAFKVGYIITLLLLHGMSGHYFLFLFGVINHPCIYNFLRHLCIQFAIFAYGRFSEGWLDEFLQKIW